MALFSLLARAYQLADGMGRFIYLVLLVLSILATWVALEKVLSLHRLMKEARALSGGASGLFAEVHRVVREAALTMLDKNRKLQGLSSAEPTFLSRDDIQAVRERLESKVEEVQILLRKHLFILTLTVTLAPFMGILGTVWGLLLAFQEVTSAGSAMGGAGVLSGLSTSLATTAVGLLVAIPAMIFSSWIRAKSEEVTGRLYLFGEKAVADLELQYRRVG